MPYRAVIRWTSFTLCLGLPILFPLVVLWGGAGAAAGALLTAGLMTAIGWNGKERIARRLGAKRLCAAEAPHVHGMIDEYCRRLHLPKPEVRWIETPAINLGVFGFSTDRACLVVTRGALESLSRESLSALLGHQLAYLWHGDFIGESWLCQFLSLLDVWLPPIRSRGPRPRRLHPLRLFFRQLLLHPLVLFSTRLLRTSRDDRELDQKTVRVTRRPEALAEGFRRVDAYHQRLVFHVPFNAHALFLLPPPARAPLSRVFFATTNTLRERIASVEGLSRAVAPA